MCAMKPLPPLDRNTAIARIRGALHARSDRRWSVRGDRGTAYGWITICAPPSRCNDGEMTADDRLELAQLLSLPSVPAQGVSIPAGSDYYREYLDRAEGRAPSVVGQPYWD